MISIKCESDAVKSTPQSTEQYIDFQNLCQKYKNSTKDRVGIGLLKEKTLHAILKDYTSNDITHQEIKIGGFIADVFDGDTITEIQTGNLRRLYKKLLFFTQIHNVTVIYPISQTKWINWINPETGAVERVGKSNSRGAFTHALSELDGINHLLNHPNLTVKLMLLETEENRLLDGYGKNKTIRATKADIFPLRLIDTLTINSTEDLKLLLPQNLPQEFTAKEFYKCAKFNSYAGSFAKRLLVEYGILLECGKSGRSTLWKYSG